MVIVGLIIGVLALCGLIVYVLAMAAFWLLVAVFIVIDMVIMLFIHDPYLSFVLSIPVTVLLFWVVSFTSEKKPPADRN